jgi:hypothetical protein
VDDPALRKELRGEVERLQVKHSFGLVFESHLPERVRLLDHAIRAGGTVVFRDDPESPTYEVASVIGGAASMRMVRDADGSLRVLDLEEPAVRVGVQAFTGGKVTSVYEATWSLPYE